MKKFKTGNKCNIFKLSIIIFLVFFLAVNINASIKYLTAEEKAKRFGLENFYGFYPSGQENGIKYNWTKDDAAKILEKKGNILCIPVGNDKPEIKENNINLKITVNEEIEYNDTMNSNDWKIISINVGKIKDDYIKVKFEVDKTWKAVDLTDESMDGRLVGVKVGEIYWK